MVRYGTIRVPTQTLGVGSGVTLTTKAFPAGQTVNIARWVNTADASANTQVILPVNINAAQPIRVLLMFSSQTGTNTGTVPWELWATGANSGSVVAAPGYMASQAVTVAAAGARVYLADLGGILPGVYGPNVYARFQIWRRTAGNSLATGADVHALIIRYRILG